MIKVIAQINNRKTLILGIARDNVDLMMTDHPMIIDLQALQQEAKMWEPIQDIIIIADETLEALHAQLSVGLGVAYQDAEANGRVRETNEA
jgi:hypothetical protein